MAFPLVMSACVAAEIAAKTDFCDSAIISRRAVRSFESVWRGPSGGSASVLASVLVSRIPYVSPMANLSSELSKSSSSVDSTPASFASFATRLESLLYSASISSLPLSPSSSSRCSIESPY